MKKIVIILGAGASFDYGFPTGIELTEKIGDRFLNQEIINDLDSYPNLAARESLKNGIKLINQHFFKSRSLSIDSWLAKPENIDCVTAAKLLISYYISISEERQFSSTGFFSKIYSSNSNDWYRELFNQLVSENFENFPKTDKNLSIVSFNYDMSLEYFLLNTVYSTYIGHSYEECWAKIQKIDIYHVHGQIGLLPINNASESDQFGKTREIKDPSHRIHALIKRSENLNIIPELRNQKSDTIISIQSKLSKADVIYFVGFSYDPINLELLGFPFESQQNRLEIRGTAFGMEKGEISNAISRVRVSPSNGQKMLQPSSYNCDAYTFFRQEIIQSLYN